MIGYGGLTGRVEIDTFTRDLARRRKAQRRFIAVMNALWGYHPLHQRAGLMPTWWCDLVAAHGDDDVPEHFLTGE